MATNRLYAETDDTLPATNVTPGAGALGSAAKSGDPVVIGKIPGVMQGDATAAGVGVVQRDGIYDLSVKGVDGGGNAAIALGDILYFTAADTPPLSAKTTGVRFGYALKGVASGATATIPVQVGY